ncbi:glycosyltransferase [Roseovarius spongiae]|uniref:Glycosyltransferase n=1 Tax=Roseovarius spongiae TaxID=2320272 RepID=A0A3A8B0D8_9RHOB|nr:WecB/TagA/CpsF family glycosyltransferase [Roseovarius spongiae]RKF16920.1 glycosyltransferase [Roseovarius spongiae]
MQFTQGDSAVRINIATRAALLEAVRAALRARRGFALATLNLDHLVKLRGDPAFAAAYATKDIVVADGRPVAWLSWIAGDPVELLPGSDLVEPLCRLAAQEGRTVALLGSTQDVLEKARAALCRDMPALSVVLLHAPPMGFDPDSEAAAEILREVEASGAGLCFLALGAPKQERLAARGRGLAPSVGFASVGAGLDFLGGGQKRAPRAVRALAFEWLWRAAGDPRRMIPRYARCLTILPELLGQAVRQRRR